MSKREIVLHREPSSFSGQEFIFGGEQLHESDVTPARKTVLLLGKTRSGKSSLINAFANYLYTVREDDEYRYMVVPRPKRRSTVTSISSTSSGINELNRRHVETKQISTYVFNNTVLSHPVALVDSPPIGREEAEVSLEQIRNDPFEQIRKWLLEEYYCPLEDLEIWLVIAAGDSHLSADFWKVVQSVVREIDCPFVRVLPIITYATRREPKIALSSLAKAGYIALKEGEDYFTFNSKSILNFEGNLAGRGFLNFSENYEHMRQVLLSLQKRFQWMTIANGDSTTTIMKFNLSRENDDKTRLYTTGCFLLNKASENAEEAKVKDEEQNAVEVSDFDNSTVSLPTGISSLTDNTSGYAEDSTAEEEKQEDEKTEEADTVKELVKQRPRLLRSERRTTGVEYEIVRFRRRKVKNEGTQTEVEPEKTPVAYIEKTIYLSSEGDSSEEELEQFLRENSGKLRRPQSLCLTRPRASTSATVGIPLSRQTNSFLETWV